MKDSGIPREEIYIISKLWLQDYGYEAAKRGLAENPVHRSEQYDPEDLEGVCSAVSHRPGSEPGGMQSVFPAERTSGACAGWIPVRAIMIRRHRESVRCCLPIIRFTIDTKRSAVSGCITADFSHLFRIQASILYWIYEHSNKKLSLLPDREPEELYGFAARLRYLM